MKLKKLEIFGFKSFAEKTEILFEDGVNAIVGPNGCGKSNVVDALKWVLGEQSARSLRGNEMQDVIFNGTERRPSLGYAEVSLTIINNKGLLPLEYSEVCITRRLYTSGESEYLINKQACRLKDIRTLFMDTGFGSNTYSVIEQGNVDSLLQANAYERRVLFEEAAGISKFKSQKKTALAKLEHVEQNLLRVGDIIEELQKQLRSIKLQAAKARKYQGYTEQLKKLKVGLSLKNYRDLKEHRVAISKERETVEEQKQKLAVIMSDLETRISEYEDETELLDQKMTQLQTESFGIEAQISKSQDKIKYNAERSKELKYRTESLLEQKNGMERKINETKYKLTESEDALRVLEQEISKRENELRTKETSYKQMQLECDMLYQGIEEKKAEVIVILQKESNIQNEIGSLTTGMESLENRKMKLMGRQEEIDNLINRFQTQHQGLMNEKNTLNDEYNCLDRNISEAKGRIQEIITTIRSLEEKVNRQKQQLSSMKSRYEVLMDYEMRAEGVDAGAKFILDEAQRDNSALQGMLGMIADKIKVDLPHALAIEIALGEKVQCIVTGTTEDAIQALSLLQKTQNGNAAFFPLERAQRQETIPEESLKHPNVIDLASNLVNGAEDIREVVDCFLSKTVVVKDLDTALELSRFNSPFRYVTLDGELLEPGGLICGGKRQGQVGIISRRSELDKIEEELSRVQEDIKKLEVWKKKPLT